MDEKKVLQINLEDVLPNRFQPRLRFHEVAINELAESIKKHGVIQPIVVRPIGDKYEIIAGERRFKASQIAGMKTIPAIVADLDDRNSAEVALIENVQREDLTPIEEAVSYKKILDMGYLTQTELANKLGKEQSTVANKLRLLNLHENVQEALLDEEISERHARSLLKLNKEQQAELLNLIIEKRLTVRMTDQEIDNILNKSDEDAEVISFDFTPEANEVNNVEENISNPGFVDVDKIEKEAKDIFVDKPEPKIDNLLNTHEEQQTEEEQQQFAPRKFFNFLPTEEDEETEEEPIIDQLFEFEAEKEINTEEKPKEEIENIDYENDLVFNENELKEEKVDIDLTDSFDNIFKTEEESTIPEFDEANKEEPEESTIPEFDLNAFDFDEKVEEVKTETVVNNSPKNVMEVVNTLRNCASQIEKEGFVLDVEEFDFDDMYQLIIKINKE